MYCFALNIIKEVLLLFEKYKRAIKSNFTVIFNLKETIDFQTISLM